MPYYENIYGSDISTDYYGVGDDPTQIGSVDVPDIGGLMQQYIESNVGEDEWSAETRGRTSVAKASQSLVDLLKQLTPEYKDTSQYFQEQAARFKMKQGIIQANLKAANAKRKAVAKHSTAGESYGKMGFRSGESGISAKYINQALQNTSTSAAASAQKARYGFKIKSDKLREGYVESLWDLYGDFIGQDPLSLAIYECDGATCDEGEVRTTGPYAPSPPEVDDPNDYDPILPPVGGDIPIIQP